MTARYFTTPLYYVNAQPHLGHAFTTILGDVMKRHYRQRGDRTFLLTGTDEHGEKIAAMAASQGKTPQQLADEVSGQFRSTWQQMNLDFDVFYRTTSAEHVKSVQKALQILKDRGEIEFREYEGHYCVGCERFLTETELTPEGHCPDHKKAPERRKEANYFFLMSRYRDRLIEHFETNHESIRPEHYRTEILSFLKQPLGDLCISRPKERLTWGIPLPFDDRFVTYVWVDALTNYLAATGWPSDEWTQQGPAWAKSGEVTGETLWGTTRHLIAKDILKTHAIYWTAMLMAWGVKPFLQLNVHGYWLVGGTKMSKSLGNVIRPLEVEAVYGRETLRYYLLREMSFGMDSTFTLESYVNSINAHLANGIGNLASRVLTLCQKNFQGKVLLDQLTDADRLVLEKRQQALTSWNEAFEELKFQNALKSWSDLVTAVDLYVNDNKPWALAKDPAQTQRLQVVLGVCCMLLEALAVIVYPVLPEASVKLLASLGLSDFDIHARTPGLELVTENRSDWVLAAEVPKLFARVALPKEE
ncbi:MAG: hypothetical protein RJB38_1716 [Pseudomonadota bacterium]|jgi:methionyl-tRNA synthetase